MQGREHLKFLMRLKDIMPLRDAFLGQMEQALTSHGFHLQVSPDATERKLQHDTT